MDWGVLISAIISILTCSGVIWWLNPKAAKKKPELENDATEAQVLQTQAHACSQTILSMQETIKSQEDRNRELFEMNVNAHEEINMLKSDLIQCTSAMCRLTMCPLRVPERGLGDELLKECKEKKTNLFDNSDFEEFAESKGYSIKKIKKMQSDKDV